uniref:C2H2-type domain-containing protein n=1 Tax=Trichobilharzia regenti TaxID=157069 RepID=A0AA85IRJ9_TRIRE|nr:unnamed protein product [Trichobilharzia regenti]
MTQRSFALPSNLYPVSDLVAKPVTCPKPRPSILLSKSAPSRKQKCSLPLEPNCSGSTTATKRSSVSLRGATHISVTRCSAASSKATVVSSLPNKLNIHFQPKSIESTSTNLTLEESFQGLSTPNGSANTVRIQLGSNSQIDRNIRNPSSSVPRVLPMYQVPCEVCGTSISNETSVQRSHIDYRHTQKFFHMLTLGIHYCSRCCRGFPDVASFIIHIQSMHFFTIPGDFDALCTHYLSNNQEEASDNHMTVVSSIFNLLTLYTSLSRSTIFSYTLPDNITVYCELKGRSSCVKCSVCNSIFLTTGYLDLHMAQANHQYWCPLCPYACQRAISLWKHYSRNHESGGGGGSRRRSPVIASSKLRRVISPEPTVTTLSPTQTVTTPITSLFGSTTIVTPISTQQQCNGRVILSDKLQFHSCDLCREFFVAVEDFNAHNERFHRIEILDDDGDDDSRDNSDDIPASVECSSSSNKSNNNNYSNTTPSITPITTSNQSSQSTSSASSMNSEVSDGTKSRSTSNSHRILIMDSSLNEQSMCKSVPSRNNIGSNHSEKLSTNDEDNINKSHRHVVVDEININDDVDGADCRNADNTTEGQRGLQTTTAPDIVDDEDDFDDDEFVCPMCEFHSKQRSDIMQHIVDYHENAYFG